MDMHDKKEKKFSQLVLWGCILAAILVAITPLIGNVGSANIKTAGTVGLWVNFLGGFHPLFLHLPIGAFVLVLFMEGGSLVCKCRYKQNMTIALGFAASSSIFAMLFGYFLYLTGDYTGELMEEHKRDGIIFTVLLILTFLLRYSLQFHHAKWMKYSYFLMLFLTGGMMMSAGHHGGEMTHGDLFRSYPSNVKAARDAKSSDPMIYAEIVHPIIENKCVSCHGPDKDKGGLRMDTMKQMLSGGDTEDCLIPGDVSASYMIASIELPIDDEYRMPPKEKPQITENELKILKWWIEIGAPEEKKLSEVQVSENIKISIQAIESGEK